ncbi:unnamed protein product [Lactuca virosa]|uniref:Uncharacterized protein n=1 Tax=Lactuca virosa TaxID=75947 RepID=A0AAU9P085_9ASTR|nr:unnamed protein product [Lactuca virosa]
MKLLSIVKCKLILEKPPTKYEMFKMMRSDLIMICNFLLNLKLSKLEAERFEAIRYCSRLSEAVVLGLQKSSQSLCYRALHEAALHINRNNNHI